jgi:excisionase family DNA binding protein
LDWANLKADYERLGSYAAVAREYGVTKGYVAQQAKQGINPRPGGRSLPVDEAAALTGLSRDLLYDQMRTGKLAYLKVGRRRIITRQDLEAFLTQAAS